MTVNDQTLEWSLEPHGQVFLGAIMFGLLRALGRLSTRSMAYYTEIDTVQVLVQMPTILTH